MFGPERHFCPVEFPWETPVQLGLARIRRSGNLRGIRVGFFEFVQISSAQSCAHAPSFVARKKELFHSQKFPSPTTFPKDSCACSTWYNRCAVKSAAQLRICGERTFLIRTPFVDNFLTNLSFLPCVQLEIAIHNYFDFFGRQIFVKFCRGVSLAMLRGASAKWYSEKYHFRNNVLTLPSLSFLCFNSIKWDCKIQQY